MREEGREGRRQGVGKRRVDSALEVDDVLNQTTQEKKRGGRGGRRRAAGGRVGGVEDGEGGRKRRRTNAAGSGEEQVAPTSGEVAGRVAEVCRQEEEGSRKRGRARRVAKADVAAVEVAEVANEGEEAEVGGGEDAKVDDDTGVDGGGGAGVSVGVGVGVGGGGSGSGGVSGGVGGGGGKGQRSELSAVILFAHGAGAPSSSPWMVKWKQLLEEEVRPRAVISFNYPYMDKSVSSGRRTAPPRAESLVKFHREQVDVARQRFPGCAVVLCGKSMGSRVGAMVAAEADAGVAAVVCLGYPLRGINGKSRAHTLEAVTCPLLLVQGTKDSLGPIDQIYAAAEAVRKAREENRQSTDRHSVAAGRGGSEDEGVEVVTVEGGDHSLVVAAKKLKEMGTMQDDVDRRCACAIAAFLARFLHPTK